MGNGERSWVSLVVPLVVVVLVQTAVYLTGYSLPGFRVNIFTTL